MWYLSAVYLYSEYVTQNYSKNLRYLESFTQIRDERDSLKHNASSKYNGDIENLLFQKSNMNKSTYSNINHIAIAHTH